MSKRTNESYSLSELYELDFLLIFHPSFKPLKILRKKIFSWVEY